MQGFVEDVVGTKVATLIGRWDDSMYYVKGDHISKIKGSNLTQSASLLWKRNKPPTNPTRYNLSSFAITLNELTSELQVEMTHNVCSVTFTFFTLIHLYFLF